MKYFLKTGDEVSAYSVEELRRILVLFIVDTDEKQTLEDTRNSAFKFNKTSVLLMISNDNECMINKLLKPLNIFNSNLPPVFFSTEILNASDCSGFHLDRKQTIQKRLMYNINEKHLREF